METAITKPVNEILADERRALKGMLGTSLGAEQQVFILAYTPGANPSDEAQLLPGGASSACLPRIRHSPASKA